MKGWKSTWSGKVGNLIDQERLEIYLIRKGWKSNWSWKVGNLLDEERFPAREVDFLHSSSPQHLKPSFCLLQQVHVKFCHWSLIMAVCANQWNLSWHKKTDFSIDAQQIYYLSHSKLFPCVLVWELRRWFKRYEGDKFLTTTTTSSQESAYIQRKKRWMQIWKYTDVHQCFFAGQSPILGNLV